MHLQYIPRNMHKVFALLCFVVVIHWLIFPYPSGLLYWHCGNLTIAPVPAKQPWWIWINISCDFIMNDCITTTKQSITKPCVYFLGYTVAMLTCLERVRLSMRLLFNSLKHEKMTEIKQMIFPNVLSSIKWWYNDSSFMEVCFLESNLQYVAIGPDTGLALKRALNAFWTNVYWVQRCHWTSLCKGHCAKLFGMWDRLTMNKYHLRMYMHLRTPATAITSPPTTVMATTKARNRNDMADIIMAEEVWDFTSFTCETHIFLYFSINWIIKDVIILIISC